MVTIVYVNKLLTIASTKSASMIFCFSQNFLSLSEAVSIQEPRNLAWSRHLIHVYLNEKRTSNTQNAG